MFINHFSIEEFSRPVDSVLISTRADTNILNFVCPDLSSKTEISKFIVNSVKKRDKSSFPTHSHVVWSMECIGFCFSLSIDNHATISSALDIYRTWLSLGSEDRPDCISESESFYQQEIISHISILFQERGGDLHRHAELCRDVLILIKDLCRQKTLDESTWNHLLSIFLLMSSSLLKSNSSLTKEITPLLFKVLFEIWLRSNTRKFDLWKDLNEYSTSWVKNVWFIHHWASVELALTKNVIGLVYGNESKKLKILFKQLPKPFECEAEIVQAITSQEQNIYFWYQFWELIKKKTLALPPKDIELCKELVKSVASLTDEILNFASTRDSESRIKYEYQENNHEKLNDLLKNFQNIHDKYIDRQNTVPIPRINAILNIFGTWLFEYANSEVYYCEKGKAIAVGAISRIYSSDLGPVTRNHSGQLYSMLLKLFKNESSQLVIKKLLKHSTSLFSCKIPGIRLLTDRDNILRLLLSQIKDKKSESKNRFYCYQILSTFALTLSCTTRLESVQVVQEILLEGIMNETDSENFKIIVWITCGFILVILEEIDILQSLILSLVNRLKNITHDQMFSDLISVVSTIPFLVTQPSVCSGNFSHKIVTKLCGYVCKRLYCHTDIIVELLFALQKWLRCFDFVLNDLEIRTKLLEVLSCCKLSDKGGTLSEYIEEFALYNLGFFHPVLEIKNSIGVEMPKGLTEELGHGWKHVWVYGNTLMSLKGNGNEIIAVIRNRMGRTIWTKKPVYEIKVEKEKLVYHIDDLDNFVEIKQPDNCSFEFDLDDDEEKVQRNVCLLMDKQANSKFDGNVKNWMSGGKVFEENQLDLNPRQILAQLGLFDYEEVIDVFEVDNETAGQVSRDLDRSSSKDTFFVSVLFLSSSTSADYLSKTDSFTEDFYLFLSQLGLKLDNRHMNLGYLSHLSIHIDHYSTILFSSDSSHDIISIVPCLTPNEMTLSEATGPSRAVVIWNSNQDDNFSIFQHNILKSPEMEHKICIILTPVKPGLIKVTLYPKTEILGPLIQNMVVPLALIGKLILYTVVNLSGNSLEVVESRKNRQSLLIGLDLLIRQSKENSKKLNNLIEYCFS